jgi:hypothetical protein
VVVGDNTNHGVNLPISKLFQIEVGLEIIQVQIVVVGDNTNHGVNRDNTNHGVNQDVLE